MSIVSERVKTRDRANPERARTTQLASNKGVARDEDYPHDDRCKLCGGLPKKEQNLILDCALEKRGNVTTETPRGYLCFHCKHLIEIIQTIGLVKLARHLIPVGLFAPARTPRQEREREHLLRYLSEV
jgi:hypothetical protein